jgi:pyruvate dehydrogenase E1 component alpha subunit
LNLASIWKLPVVFLCENNGYAATTSQAQSTAVADIAQRASAYAIPGVVVDGQDVLGVHEVVLAAVARARAGEGPTLVEAKTYRYRDHAEFGGFKMPAHRSDEELQAWRAKDPLDLFAARLRSEGRLTSDEFKSIKLAVQAEVEAAVLFAQQSSPPEPHALLEDLFV